MTTAEYQREYRKTDKYKAALIKYRQTAYYKARRKRYRQTQHFKEDIRKRAEEFKNLKVNKQCQFCGYKEHPEILQFHHLHSKIKDVSKFRHYSKKCKLEVSKCILLCPNCHMWLHHPGYKPKC